jgi:hypothetical protein
MCFSFWGLPRGDSRLTNQSATWLVYLRGVSISPEKTPKAKTHSVLVYLTKVFHTRDAPSDAYDFTGICENPMNVSWKFSPVISVYPAHVSG